jgi:chorismate mutase
MWDTVSRMPNDPTPTTEDHLIRQMRDQVMDNDLKIIQAINARLGLVKRLRAYKEQQDLEFVDPTREEWMERYLLGANPGPLSDEGLKEIYRQLLDLTKRETA